MPEQLELPVELRKSMEWVTSQSLSSTQYRTLNAVTHWAQNKRPEPTPAGPMYRMPLSEFYHYSGQDPKNRKQVREVLESLKSTIQWNILDEDPRKRDEGFQVLFQRASINDGMLEFVFSEYIQHRLCEPQRFASLHMDVNPILSSRYTIRIWEWVSAFRFLRTKNPTPVTIWLPVAKLRELTGTSDCYPKFKDFNRMVIKTALEELKEKSDLVIVPETERKQRAVHRIRFWIYDNPAWEGRPLKRSPASYSNADSKVADANEALYADLLAAGITHAKALDLIHRHEADSIRANLTYVYHQVAKARQSGREISNPAGYVVMACEEKYAETRDKSHQASLKMAKTKQARDRVRLQEKHDELTRRYQQFHREFLDDFRTGQLAACDPADVERLKESWLDQHANDTFLIKRYRDQGFDSTLTRKSFEAYCAEMAFERPTKEDEQAYADKVGFPLQRLLSDLNSDNPQDESVAA